jgi:hypothetical protein
LDFDTSHGGFPAHEAVDVAPILCHDKDFQ